MKQVTAILIGAGQRGADVYAAWALRHPHALRIVAIAEPNDEKRLAAQRKHGVPDELCVKSWEELLDQPQMADCAFICTQDNTHFEPAIRAIEQGYHLLLEKPMTRDKKELQTLAELSQKSGRVMAVCHVLRYTPFFSKVKEILDSGVIGNVMSVQLIENVAYWHQAHSFVRGNWRKSNETSPMILQKSCHDMDILLWLIGSKCTKVSSFGNLTHFKKENAPEGAPAYCLDGCNWSDTCPYNARRIYLEDDGVHVPVIRKVVSNENTDQSVEQALKNGPYGRCVYHCDNDVVDHQVVNLEFENQVTASFTMCAFTMEGSRTIKIMGTKGQIKGDVEENKIETVQFATKHRQVDHLHVDPTGHSGGDAAFMADFVRQIRLEGSYEGRTRADASVESHLIALAAEHSRVSGQTVEMKNF